jgi:hypothetical protein
MKKTRSKKSRDTVPLTLVYTPPPPLTKGGEGDLIRRLEGKLSTLHTLWIVLSIKPSVTEKQGFIGDFFLSEEYTN